MEKLIKSVFVFTTLILFTTNNTHAAGVDLTVNGASQTTVSGGDALNFTVTSDAPNRRVMLMVAPDCINYQRNAVGRTDANNEYTLNVTVPNGLSDSSYCFEAFGQTASGVKRSTPVTVNVTALGGSDDSDITPDVVPSRVSGYAPLAVYFDAKGTTHEDGSIRTFHELHYRWNFGDPLSGVWSTNQKSRNTAEGPITGHLFETPGEFTVSLTVKDANGDEATKQTTITVLDPDNPIDANDNLPDGLVTVCVARDSNFAGCPEHADEVTYTGSSINTKIAELLGQGKRRILLQEDETFEASNTIKFNVAGPGTLGSFGPAGGKATIDLTQDSKKLFHAKSPDWRIYKLNLIGSPGENTFIIEDNDDSTLRLTMAYVDAQNHTFNKGIVLIMNGLDDDAPLHTENAFIENKISEVAYHSNGGKMFFAALRRSMLLGNTFSDGGSTHMVRIQHGDGVVLAHNHLSDQAEDRHIVTIRSIIPEPDGLPGGEESDHWTRNIYMGSNHLAGSSDITFNVADDFASGQSRAHTVIVERNFFTHATPGKIQVDIKSEETKDLTVRNNVIACGPRFGYQPIKIDPTIAGEIGVYGNTVCSTDPSNVARGVRIKSGPGDVTAYNNLLYAPHANTLQVIDNENSHSVVSNNLALDSVNDNPFVSPNPGAENVLDYRLVLDSDPVNAGRSVDALIEDFIGTPRDANPDIGAFELSQ